jgi:hypothetical protein
MLVAVTGKGCSWFRVHHGLRPWAAKGGSALSETSSWSLCYTHTAVSQEGRSASLSSPQGSPNHEAGAEARAPCKSEHLGPGWKRSKCQGAGKASPARRLGAGSHAGDTGVRSRQAFFTA